MAISFACGTCGKPYKVDERFAGKKAACRACGTINKIPSGREAMREAGARSSVQREPVRVAEADDGVLPLAAVDEEISFDNALADAAAEEVGLELVEEPPVRKPAVKRAAPLRALPVEGCPNCGGTLERGAVFCTGCGFNLKTGNKASTAILEDGDMPGEYASRPPSGLRWSSKRLIIAGVGAGLALVSLFILIAVLGGGGAAPVAQAPTPIQTAPATAPTTAPDLGPKVEMISPGTYSVRRPKAGEDPVEYWKPVLDDPNPDVRAIVLDQLAKSPEAYRAAAADAMVALAADENPKVRRTVMTDLAVAKTPASLAAALKALDDADINVATRAIKLLGQYKDESAIEPLASKYAKYGDMVLAALGSYDAPLKERVLSAYKTILGAADPKARSKIISLLVQADPPNAGALLAESLADGDAEVRTAAMARLAELKHESSIAAIAERLRDDPVPAAQALIAFGAAAEPAAAAKLQDSDAKLRLVVLQVLKEIATARSLPAIRAAARDTDLAVALAAREVWRKLVPGALSPIDEALLDLGGEKQFQARALKMLVNLPVDEHQALIAAKLFDIAMGDNSDPVVAPLACDALVTWADKATRDKMIDKLKPDTDDTKRAYAIRLAVEFKDARAVRPLCECLAQGRDLANVIDALKEYGTASETYLMRLISTGESAVQGTAFDLLREIGTRRCFMVLGPLANGKATPVETKKRAKETIIAITRRLNTAAAAARKAPPLVVRPEMLPPERTPLQR